MTENLPEATADALHRAVRDLGRRVGENPDRVRAVLSDALGAAAREHRSEIDALALASEEGIPATLVGREESLLTESDVALDDSRLRGRLVERGLSAGAADYAIGAWAAALGSVSSLSVTGGLTSAVSGAGTGSVSDPATELPDDPHEADEADEAGAAGSILGFSVADDTPPRHRQVVPLGRRVVAGAAAGVLAIVAGAVWVSTSGDRPTRSALTDSALGSLASTTTTASTGAVSTTAPTAPTTKSPATTKRPTKAPSTGKASPLRSSSSPSRSSSSTSPRKSSSSSSPRRSSSSTSPRKSSSSTPPRSSSSTAPKTLVAKNTSASWTPKYYETGVNQCVDFVPPHAADNICEAALNVVKSGTVTTWSISSASSVNGHGSVRISGHQIFYAPHHNGYFTDTVRYRLSGGGVTSNWATIAITVYCNQDMGCWG